MHQLVNELHFSSLKKLKKIHVTFYLYLFENLSTTKILRILLIYNMIKKIM